MRDYVTRARGTAFLETLFQDLKYAARGLRRSPGFTLVASMSIALGVAANATVFSIVNAALLRPVPGATSDGLVRMYVNHHSPFDLRDLVWLRDHATSFRDIVGEWHNAASFRAAAGADAERAQVSYVTRGFFPALGVRMALGRAFDAAEGSAGGAPVGVVTSGSFGPSVERSIGMGYVPSAQAAVGSELAVEIRGATHAARVVKTPFHPSHTKKA